jgi:ubiquinone/menaquinone biosynthesis C-methylase UbiE
MHESDVGSGEQLGVIARLLAGPTRALLDRFEPLAGALAIDAGCGAGDVTFELLERVGARGRVIGFDLDEIKLAAASAKALRRELNNIEFQSANVLERWPATDASLVNIRFVLTHLPNPNEMLARAREALRPGGAIIVTEVDLGGQFCDPPCAAFDRYGELYVEAARRRREDPFIGRSLVRLLERAGFMNVDTKLVQPFARSGELKEVAAQTLAAISESLITALVATREEVEHLTKELREFADRPDTFMSFPRIFQAWGVARPHD